MVHQKNNTTKGINMKQLVINGLSKTYPNGVKALNEVNLTINSGMFGLLGPNGAGKSTLMRIIATLQDPDEGSVTLNGMDVLKQKQDVRKVLGFLPQEFDFYPKVKAEDMLDHFAILKGVSNKRERNELVKVLLNRTNLYEHRRKKVGGFSGGMKQRLGIAQALIGNPELLIVDEPTAGLDPKERRHFHNLLSEIGENMIVILSTHIVDDVSDLCKDMAIINKGTVKITGNPADAINELSGKVWSCLIEKNELAEYNNRHQIIATRLFMGKQLIHVYSEIKPGEEFKAAQPDLEHVYFSTIPPEIEV